MGFNVPPAGGGIPALLGGNTGVATTALTSLADAPGLAQSLGGPEYGIFQGGASVVTADTVLAIDYRREWVIADHPVEKGAFESFNKVQRPFDIRFRFVSGQNQQNRAALLQSLEAIAGDTVLRTFVTPEFIYQNVTIAHIGYNRTVQNIGLMEVDVWGWQVIETSTGQTYDTPSVSNASPTDLSQGVASDVAGTALNGGFSGVNGLGIGTVLGSETPGASAGTGAGGLGGFTTGFPGPIASPGAAYSP